MPAASIAAEIEAAFREVAQATGDGGFTVTLIDPGDGQVNPWDEPDTGAIKHEGIPGKLGIVPDEWVDGTLIRADDELLDIAGTAPEPKQDWSVEIDGLAYTIEAIRTTKPAGAPIKYQLVLRNGAPATTTVAPPDPASPFSAEFSAEFA